MDPLLLYNGFGLLCVLFFIFIFCRMKRKEIKVVCLLFDSCMCQYAVLDP